MSSNAPFTEHASDLLLALWRRATSNGNTNGFEFRLDTESYDEYRRSLNYLLVVPNEYSLAFRTMAVKPTGNYGHGVYLVPVGTPDSYRYVAKKPEPLTRGSAEEYLRTLEARMGDLEVMWANTVADYKAHEARLARIETRV